MAGGVSAMSGQLLVIMGLLWKLILKMVDDDYYKTIVTGGASGVGLETARVLALRNVHVLQQEIWRLQMKQNSLFSRTNNAARVVIKKLDLSSIRSVKAFADNFKALNLTEGVIFCPFQLSEDGIEIQFATNHIGHC
ncbi:hypothetical protein K7X08_021043 [Anisodus acutangulus]|uniref:Uncharacterized protein n=1 Tax=Anisodus acutangulus TaxID=402998 RepID=A0A9Q1M3J9_9SOLA|nr:hypothetical protein K7X08_021043 [Anisodus acutangulus]